MGAIGLQEGGQFWVNRPTPLIVGEKGREFVSVTPESKMDRNQPVTNNYYTSIMNIDATDADSFERRYGGSITKVIHKNKKSGMMRD